MFFQNVSYFKKNIILFWLSSFLETWMKPNFYNYGTLTGIAISLLAGFTHMPYTAYIEEYTINLIFKWHAMSSKCYFYNRGASFGKTQIKWKLAKTWKGFAWQVGSVI